MSLMFPVCTAHGPYSSISEELLLFIFSGLKQPIGNWNLVNPLLSMNEAQMDECASRLLKPWKININRKQHQTYPIEKFRNLIITTTTTMLGTKKIFLKKYAQFFIFLPQTFKNTQNSTPLTNYQFDIIITSSLLLRLISLVLRSSCLVLLRAFFSSFTSRSQILDRQIDRQRDRQIHRQIERQIDTIDRQIQQIER